MVQQGCRGMGRARATEKLYHRDWGSRNVKTKLAPRSVLSPGHLGTGRGETSEKSPASMDRRPHWRVKELQNVPRSRPGGVFWALAASHSTCPPLHKRMSPLNLWTWGWGWGNSTEQMSPLANGWRGREDHKGRSVQWGQDGVLPPLCRLSH